MELRKSECSQLATDTRTGFGPLCLYAGLWVASVGGVLLAITVAAPAAQRAEFGCDEQRGLVQIVPDNVSNGANTYVGVRESDGAIGFNVYSERGGGRGVCVGPAFDTITFAGRRGSDDLFLDGGRRVIDYDQAEPREPFGPVPAAIAVDASGGSAEDDLIGHPGVDRLSGGAGSDKLVGGRKSDVLVGGPDRDRLIAGPGADRVDATTPFLAEPQPAHRDEVDCGGGRDVVLADRYDRLSGCETVKRR